MIRFVISDESKKCIHQRISMDDLNMTGFVYCTKNLFKCKLLNLNKYKPTCENYKNPNEVIT